MMECYEVRVWLFKLCMRHLLPRKGRVVGLSFVVRGGLCSADLVERNLHRLTDDAVVGDVGTAAGWNHDQLILRLP